MIRRGKNLVFFADLLEQEGETCEEVSKSLGVSKQCAHVLKSRVKKRLMDEVVPSARFSIAVVDREMGWQTIAAGLELPISEDPSLWHSLELVD